MLVYRKEGFLVGVRVYYGVRFAMKCSLSHSLTDYEFTKNITVEQLLLAEVLPNPL